MLWSFVEKKFIHLRLISQPDSVYTNDSMTLEFIYEAFVSLSRLTFTVLNPSGENYIIMIRQRCSLLFQCCVKTSFSESDINIYTLALPEHSLMDFPYCKLQAKTPQYTRNYQQVSTFSSSLQQKLFRVTSPCIGSNSQSEKNVVFFGARAFNSDVEILAEII